jgi:sigma-B regulation protein RsbU (phosphoserine phosphatase)
MEVWGGNHAVDTGVAMSGLDAWVYSKPFGQSEQGGDVYYVSSCATGRITRLLVADVAGHGGAVGKIAIDLRGLMRQYVNYLDQTRFVTELNARFSALSQDGCFATALVTTFFAPTNLLSLCNAGHPPPILYRASERRWRFLEPEGLEGDRAASDTANANEGPSNEDVPSNLPLGIMDLADYQQFDMTLTSGDLVLCYTDSLIESRDATGELLGSAGLLRILRDLTPTDPNMFIPHLLAAIAAEAPGNLTGDDVTVLAYRPNGKPASSSMGQRLLAPARVLRGVVSAVRAGVAAPWPDFSVANLGGACFGGLNRAWKGRKRKP